MGRQLWHTQELLTHNSTPGAQETLGDRKDLAQNSAQMELGSWCRLLPREGIALAITTPPKQTNGTAQVFPGLLPCHRGALAPDASG